MSNETKSRAAGLCGVEISGIQLPIYLGIAALITGSILGMNRKLLLKAAVRFLPVALCAMTFAILSVGIVGAVTGYGFADAIMYVAIPMMGGGMGAGVVPLSDMYAEALGQDLRC